MNAIAEQIPKLRENLIIAFGGDMNDGTGIYATQPHEQAITDVRQQAKENCAFLVEWLREVGKKCKGLEVQAVPGNHGRSGKFAAEAANWDMVLYDYLEMQSYYPVLYNKQGDIFIRKFQAGPRTVLLYHGHDIITYQNIPWYGIQRRIMSWHDTALQPFDIVLLGHFHQAGMWPINRTLVVLSGTLVTGDSWGLRRVGSEAANQFSLLTIDDQGMVQRRIIYV